jgi:hypothetical protein
MNYFNTTNETKNLKKYQKKAQSQDDIILEFFILHKDTVFSPDYVLEKMDLKCPITSVRRSISNLTKQGKLIKTERKVMGNYGRLTNTWKYAK